MANYTVHTVGQSLTDPEKAQARGNIAYDDFCPIINMDDYGVHPGNSAATNQTAIANLIAKIKNSSTINRFHLRLNRAGTFSIQKGASGAYVTRKAAILLPSNCIFELSPDTAFQMTLENLAYMIRNDDPINGNHGITIRGGQWDGNSFDGTLEEAGGSGEQGYYGDLFWLENITDLIVEDIVVRNPNLWAIAGTHLTRAVFQRVYADALPRDAIHLVGGCEDVGIYDFSGEAHDNALVISTAQNLAVGDGAYSFGNYLRADGVTNVEGDMRNIRIHRCNFTDCNGPIVIFGRQGDTIENIHISDVTGNTSVESAYAIAINQYQLDAGGDDPLSINPTIRNLVIERVRMTTKTSEVAVYLSGNNTKEVVVRDVVANGAGVHVVGNNYDSIKLDNIRATGVEHAVMFGDDSNSLPFYSRNVDIGNVVYNPSGGSRSAIRIEGNATWDSFYADNVVCSATGVTYRGISVGGSTRRRISIGSCTFGLGGEACFQGNGDFDISILKTKAQDYIATDGARLNIAKWPQHLLTAGTGAITADASVWADYQTLVFELLYTQIQTAGGVYLHNKDTILPLLPRGAVVVAAAIKSQVGFAGPGLTSLRVRNAAGGNITDEIFVTTADNSAIVWTEVSPYESAMNTAVDWQILALSYSGDLDTLTAGRAKIFLKYFVAQA